MNNAQKLADEALQVYRATGLSPMEIEAQRQDLKKAMQEIKKAHHSDEADGGEMWYAEVMAGVVEDQCKVLERVK